MGDRDQLAKQTLITLAYETRESPFAFYNPGSVLQVAADNLDEDYDQTEKELALQQLEDRYFVDHEGAIGGWGTVQITSHGLRQAEEWEGKEIIEQSDLESVLELLSDLNAESPNSFWGGEGIVEESDLDADTLDACIWFLREEGYVEAQMATGDPPWAMVRITASGRRYLQDR